MGYTIWPDGPTGDVLAAVNQERNRQEDLRRQGKFQYTCASRVGLSLSDKLAILAEEFGEVARHVTEGVIDPMRVDGQKLRKELVEVAAVAVAWAESLERSKGLGVRLPVPEPHYRVLVNHPDGPWYLGCNDSDPRIVTVKNTDHAKRFPTEETARGAAREYCERYRLEGRGYQIELVQS